MSKHEVTIGMTQEIKELMYVEGYASESTRIAEFIAANHYGEESNNLCCRKHTMAARCFVY